MPRRPRHPEIARLAEAVEKVIYDLILKDGPANPAKTITEASYAIVDLFHKRDRQLVTRFEKAVREMERVEKRAGEARRAAEIEYLLTRNLLLNSPTTSAGETDD